MERQKKEDTDMTEGVIWKHCCVCAAAVVANVFQQFYNTVDSIVVGNFVGKEALAAVGSVGSIINSVIGFFGRPGNWCQCCHRPELWGEK